MNEAELWMPGESEGEGAVTPSTETRVAHDDESPDTPREAEGPSNAYDTHGQEGYEGGEEGEEDDGLMFAHRGEPETEGHEDAPQPQEMPRDFYTGVDAFLSRPAPTLERVIASPNPTAPHPNNHAHAPRHNAGVSRAPPLPTHINHPTTNTNISNKCVEGKGCSKSKSGLDPLLLAEAFAYAQRLEHIMTGQQEGDSLSHHNQSKGQGQVGLAGVKQLRKTRSHNQQQMSSAIATTANARLGSSGSTGGGMAMAMTNKANRTTQHSHSHSRRHSEPTLLTHAGLARALVPRSKGQQQQSQQAVHKKTNSKTTPKQPPKECEWSLGVGERNADMNTGTIRQDDMQRLVSNFEAKTSIQQLRRELEESQASMHRSEAIIRSVVTDFYGPTASTTAQYPPPFLV